MESYAKMVHATLAITDAPGGWMSYVSIVKYMQDNFVQVAGSSRARLHIRNAIKALVEQGYVVRRKHSFKLCKVVPTSPSSPKVVRKTVLKKKVPSNGAPPRELTNVTRRQVRQPSARQSAAARRTQVSTQQPVYLVQQSARSAPRSPRSPRASRTPVTAQAARSTQASTQQPVFVSRQSGRNPLRACRTPLVAEVETGDRKHGLVGDTKAAVTHHGNAQGDARLVRTIPTASASMAQHRQRVSPIASTRVSHQATRLRPQSGLKKKNVFPPLTIASAVAQQQQSSSNPAAMHSYFKTRTVQKHVPQAKARLVKTHVSTKTVNRSVYDSPRPVIPQVAPVPGARQSRRLAKMPPWGPVPSPSNVRLLPSKARTPPQSVTKTTGPLQPAKPTSKASSKKPAKSAGARALQSQPAVSRSGRRIIPP